MRTLLIVCAALAVGAAEAHAAKYVARSAGGGRIALTITGGWLVRAKAALPAGCESRNGRRWQSRLAVDLTGDVPLRGRRFRIQGQAPNKVRYDISGRLRGRTVVGRARLTLLELDYVSPSDDSYFCNTGARYYRAIR